MERALLSDSREKEMAEDLWLHYFNRYLFENGTISEKEYKKMTEKIAGRRAKLSRTGIKKGMSYEEKEM